MLLLLPETHFPAFLEENRKLSLPLQPVWTEVSSLRAQCWPGPVAVTSLLLGLDPSLLASVPFPMCQPSLADRELKISETQGITGCLNISLL